MGGGTGGRMQELHFASSADGVGIAYAVHGSGPPLLIDACWLSHLQFDWQSPVWRHWLDELQRMAPDADTALLARSQRRFADSRRRLPELNLPALVLHSRGDQMNGLEHSRYLTAHIRGARLVALDSNNHIVLADEPAWPVLLHELTDFLAAYRLPSVEASSTDADLAALLSTRELDILTLAARGRDNAEIAAELVLSVRTVERHLQNAYGKLGLQGRTARTAAVARLLAHP